MPVTHTVLLFLILPHSSILLAVCMAEKGSDTILFGKRGKKKQQQLKLNEIGIKDL